MRCHAENTQQLNGDPLQARHTLQKNNNASPQDPRRIQASKPQTLYVPSVFLSSLSPSKHRHSDALTGRKFTCADPFAAITQAIRGYVFLVRQTRIARPSPLLDLQDGKTYPHAIFAEIRCLEAFHGRPKGHWGKYLGRHEARKDVLGRL